jgi:hypothetical protein
MMVLMVEAQNFLIKHINLLLDMDYFSPQIGAFLIPGKKS